MFMKLIYAGQQRLAGFVLVLVCVSLGIPESAQAQFQACSREGEWFAPASGQGVEYSDLVTEMADQSVVLLGEAHDSAADHRWQLQVLAALHSRRTDMVIGLEMIPRSGQAALDAWIEGGHTTESFLDAVKWEQVWGFDAGLYMPIFQFARQNGIRLLALNVDRSLINLVARQGWEAAPENQREGVDTPAEAPEGYVKRLREVYEQKREGDESAKNEPFPEEEFAKFVDAQLTWDRAMAKAMADEAATYLVKPPLFVALVGRFHAAYRYGISHQLDD